jgi:hypothetical protein
MPELIINATCGYSANEIFDAVRNEGNVRAEISGESFHINGDNINLVRIYRRLTGKKIQYLSSPTILLRRSE